ncbi:hypothetical protein Sru01_29490 [Sphaerisporangium rufum]|uniref:Uncharacterized protein n=1 Tax=Sphaerisporangium rufum TaxID=1381558 RepID=A0A919V0X8_9ACTN|nr:hypothetical protein Sru01_29490 [Sphaerisporangium rufum]
MLEMPPVPLWYRGQELYGRFIARVRGMRGTGWRMVPVPANTRPALAAYRPAPGGGHVLHTLQVLTVTRGECPAPWCSRIRGSSAPSHGPPRRPAPGIGEPGHPGGVTASRTAGG